MSDAPAVKTTKRTCQRCGCTYRVAVGQRPKVCTDCAPPLFESPKAK